MLIEFSVANFLSFKERVTFSMVASNASEEKETANNVFQSESAAGHLSLLKTAAIYGANASGKSNLIKAFFFMKDFILNSVKQKNTDPKIDRKPFKIDQRCIEKPSYFNLLFLYEGIEYNYGFEIDNHRVHREWLKLRKSKKQALVFERRLSKQKNKDGYQFKKGTAWQGEWKSIQSITRPDSLFLSVASQFNNATAAIVTDWFRIILKGVDPNPYTSSELGFTSMLASEKQTKEQILDYLKLADLGIADFIVAKRPMDDELKEIVSFIKINKKRPAADDVPLDQLEVIDISTIHNGLDSEGNQVKVTLKLYEESDGTQKFFALSGPLHYVLSNGSVLLADELDTRLHPLLTRWIIELFHNPKTNPKNAQLIFATHDEGLLDRKLLRRDQIWFTKKNADSATKLYSLWDIKTRKEEDYRKGYLMGRYGAIPFLEQGGE